NVHARAHECNAAIRDAARQQGMEEGVVRQSRVAQRTQHGRRQGDVRGRCRSIRSSIHRAVDVSRLSFGAWSRSARRARLPRTRSRASGYLIAIRASWTMPLANRVTDLTDAQAT